MPSNLIFKKLTLSDRDMVLSFTQTGHRKSCNLSFSNLMSWRSLYRTEWAVIADCLVFRFYFTHHLQYLMPLGKHLREALNELIPYTLSQGLSFQIQDICVEHFPLLESMQLPEPYCNRDFCDYVYLRQDLAELSGKHYKPKRNFVNRFQSLYPSYRYEHLTPENMTRAHIEECLRMENEWCKAKDCEENTSLSYERQSIHYALNHFKELWLFGGILYVNDSVVAFTYGTIINHETFGIHVEKADTAYEGSYAMINHLFAFHLPETYVYLNREEDLGIEGLRKAKLSYQPALLLQKCTMDVPASFPFVASVS